MWFRPEFDGVISDNVIFILKKEKPSKKSTIKIAEYPSLDFKEIPQENYLNSSDFVWSIIDDKLYKIIKKIKTKENIFELGLKFQTSVGFIAKQGTLTKDRSNDKQIRVFKGENILRFGLKSNYYFEFKKENLVGGTQDIKKLSKKNKVFLRKTGDTIIAQFDNTGTFPEQSVYFIYTDDDKKDLELKSLCALLNSKLLNCYYFNFAVTNKDATPQLKKMDLDKFPVILPHNLEKWGHLIDKLILLNKDLTKFGETSEDGHKIIENKNKLLFEIDQLVYELYSITKEEQKIIEENLK